MKILKDETTFMRDNNPALDVDVTAVVSPTYKKSIEDREKIKDRIKKELKDKEARKEPVLGTKADKLTLGESLFEDLNEEKKINEENELSSSPYKGKIGDHFDYSTDFEFLDVVADILERAVDNYEGSDDDDLDNAVFEAIDEGLIYYSDQWKVLEHYMNPQEANWDEAVEMLNGDIYTLASEIIEENKEDREREEEAEREEADESLKEAKEEVEDEDEFTEVGDNVSLTLHDKVYDEIFGLADVKKDIKVSKGDTVADYNKYFAPENHPEKHPKLGNDVGIGVLGEAGIKRLEKVADIFKLKVVHGKSGKSAYVIIPREYAEEKYNKWIKDKGIKIPKN